MARRAGDRGAQGLLVLLSRAAPREGARASLAGQGHSRRPPGVAHQIPDTAKARGMTEDQVKEQVILAAQPTKQFVTVEEVASLALYLCSDGARQITGAILSMDGGWTAA